MAKKKKSDKIDKLPPRPTRIDDAYEKSLLKKKRELENRIEGLRGRRAFQVGNAGFWGSFTVIAMGADFALLGGMGTGMAIGSVFLVSHFGAKVQDTVKEMKEVNERLKEYGELKEMLRPSQPSAAAKPQQPSTPSKDFRKAAPPVPDKKVAELQKKLGELNRQTKDAKKPQPPTP